jgi:hypothetical protein
MTRLPFKKKRGDEMSVGVCVLATAIDANMHLYGHFLIHFATRFPFLF